MQNQQFATIAVQMDYVDIGFRSGDLCNSKSMGSFGKEIINIFFKKCSKTLCFWWPGGVPLSSFCCFSVVAIALLRLRGWLIFIRISNSGRPTVLTVDSWFVVWLLNNRPALHTVAHVAAWLINSQATNHHIRNVGLQRISYSNKPGACQAQKRCSKSLHNFTKRRTPFWGPKNGPRLGVRFLC